MLPTIAAELHQEHIASVVRSVVPDEAWEEEVDAIAVTVMPGMALSLKVGLVHAKQLARVHQ